MSMTLTLIVIAVQAVVIIVLGLFVRTFGFYAEQLETSYHATNMMRRETLSLLDEIRKERMIPPPRHKEVA